MSILTTIKEKRITNRARQRTEAFNYLFNEAVDSVSGGEFYLFEYKPKFLKRLDHWDRYPMVIVGDSTPDGFYGANLHYICLLYTSPSPRDRTRSRMPSSA